MTRMGWLVVLVSGCATATPAKMNASATAMPPTPTRTTPATATATTADKAHASGATRIDLGPAGDGDRIELPLGGQQVVPSDGVTNFATTADVVQIKSRQDGRQLILNAVKPGDSALTLIYADGTVHSYAIHVSATTPQ